MNIIHSVSIKITTDLIYESLTKILKDQENKEEFVRLFHDLLGENYNAHNLFFTLMLGGKLPALPPIEQPGFVKLEDLPYGFDKAVYKQFSKHGFVPCKVVGHKGIHTYSPIRVKFPDLGGIESEGAIPLESFHYDDVLDLYDDLPI